MNKRVIAVIVNLLIPGLGFIYINKKKVGVFILLLTFILALLVPGLLIYTDIPPLIYLIAVLGWHLYINLLVLKYLKKDDGEFIPLKWYKLLLYIFLAGLFIFMISEKLVNKYFYQTYVITSSNLNPTLTAGDRIIGKKVFNKEKITRYDIITFKKESDPIIYTSRVVGLPGEEIEMINNKVYIDGLKLEDPYGFILENRYNNLDDIISDFTKIKIPKDKLFVLGDNRNCSLDSRYIGLIDLNKVDKKIVKIYYSNDFKRVGKGL